LLLNLARTVGSATARRCVVRFAAFLFAVLAAFSLSFGSAHAHAAMAAESYAAADHIVAGKGHTSQEHVHTASCNDSNTDHDGHDGVCVSVSACGACAPLPSAGIVFIPQGMPAAAEPGSVSFPSDPPTLDRPPKLTVTA